MNSQFSFLYRNGLTLALLVLFLGCIIGQIATGLNEYNDERSQHDLPTVSLDQYFVTGHFVETTFENWESEFLQMSMYVLLTVGLRQQGSSESKKLDEKEEVDRIPDPLKRDAPWPVKRGGFILVLYRNSLSLAFVVLFLLSFVLHALGSLQNFNEERIMDGGLPVKMSEFMTMSRFWFESFQNWQSEFVAVISIVVLSIYLRQYGSPESKPVDASMSDTGSG
jgi:hypothetical protein